MNAKLTFIVSLCCCICGCESIGGYNKEQIGTAAGVVSGAILGAALSSDKDRGKGMIIGGAIGAIAGNRIGHHLDERDKQAFAAKTQEVLETAEVGETVTWESDHTDASATITTLSKRTKTDEIVVSPEVSRRYRYVSVNLNVRQGAGANYPVVTSLPVNTLVLIEEDMRNGWYRVSRGGSSIGYVSAEYLVLSRVENPIDSTVASESPARAPTTGEEAAALKVSHSTEHTVISQTECKTVMIRTKVDGNIEENEVETCQGQDGSWGA